MAFAYGTKLCIEPNYVLNQTMYYKILFKAVWNTLHSFGYTHYGAETGAVAVLHSWGQNLSLHPHIHCIVPIAGYSLKEKWKNIGTTNHYLYPVHELSDTFKGKFLDSLKRKLRKSEMYNGFYKHVQKAYKSRWVVYSESSMAGAEHVIRYLGQYTHRVTIANHRILNVSRTHVTFIAKDYRDRAVKKPVTLEGVEFLRRFCMHVFPKRFVKIRRYGIYNPTIIRNLDLQFVPEQKPDIEQLITPRKKETPVERVKRLTGFDVSLCPACKKGRMHVIREMPRIRSPATHLPTLLSIQLH